MIPVKQIWLAVHPMDMRCGADTALARVVQDFGAARPHHAYVFANKRANRIKVLVHDGVGIWLAARRLNKGKFIWPDPAGDNYPARGGHGRSRGKCGWCFWATQQGVPHLATPTCSPAGVETQTNLDREWLYFSLSLTSDLLDLGLQHG